MQPDTFYTPALHEVPIFRLARRLREAQDTAWGVLLYYPHNRIVRNPFRVTGAPQSKSTEYRC